MTVFGTQKTVLPIEIGVDTVYVRTNIERITTEDFTGWEYEEVQYSLPEFQQLLAEKSEQAEVTVQTSTEYLLDVDFRLVMVELGL